MSMSRLSQVLLSVTVTLSTVLIGAGVVGALAPLQPLI